MIVAITLPDNTVYRVSADSLESVQKAIADEVPLVRFWYDSATGKRWEETTIFVERPRLIAEDTQEPVE